MQVELTSPVFFSISVWKINPQTIALPRLTTRERLYLVIRGHFRSRDGDGSHTIRSAVSENAIYTAQISLKKSKK